MLEKKKYKELTVAGVPSQKGGDPQANSMAVIPRAHMSTFSVYSRCCIISGAIQHGVPTKDRQGHGVGWGTVKN